MLSLEQAKLLESRVAGVIDYAKRITAERERLEADLKANQNRISELEIVLHHFKEDQGRIEDGILSALDRLNQFEDAIEKSLAGHAPRGEDQPAAPIVDPGRGTSGEGLLGKTSSGFSPQAVSVPAVKPPIFAAMEEEEASDEAEEEIESSLEPEGDDDPDGNTGEAELDIF